MFPRVFFVVLALALILTGALVNPVGATLETFDVVFSYAVRGATRLLQPYYWDADVAGEFKVSLDPTKQSIGPGLVQVVSLTGAFGAAPGSSPTYKLNNPLPSGIFLYFPEIDGGTLRLAIDWGDYHVLTPHYSKFALSIADFATPYPAIVSTTLDEYSGILRFQNTFTATQFSSSDVSKTRLLGGPPSVPIPPSCLLLGTGLLGLAGWRRFRKGN